MNVGLPTEQRFGDRTVTTGINKREASGPVHLADCQLAGDGQADLVNHGGPDKAAYAYSRESYLYWEHELGRPD